jgi:hypothetical protein
MSPMSPLIPPSPLLVTIEPRSTELQMSLFCPGRGPSLRARLPVTPREPGALLDLLEALSRWHGQPLHAVLDAGATDVQAHPERWAALLGDAHPAHVQVEWVALPSAPRKRSRWFALGRSRRAERLASFAGAGAP